MGRLRAEPLVDPSTGKLLPEGVWYRGKDQYLARKLVNGRRVAKTFETAKRATDWLKAVEVDHDRGVFMDTTAAQRVMLGSLLRSYQLEVLADDPDRVVLDDDGNPSSYSPMRPVTERMTTELLGAAQEITFIDVILRDEVCAARMATLSGADMARFRNRMKADGYAASTIVRRLNLIARAVNVARLEWGINIPLNPADAEHCARPRGADIKRDRVLLPAPYEAPSPAPNLIGAAPARNALRQPANPAHPSDPEAGALDREALLPVDRGVQGDILPPLSERDDFVLGEEERLLSSCARSPSPAPDPWLIAAAKLATATAMRQGEICALEWPHVNFVQRTITVLGPERANGTRCTKNRTVRVIPMLDDAYEILSSLPRGDDRRVIKLGQNALKMRFRRAVAAAGLKDLTFHDLRHVATSRLAKIYKDPLTLKLVTGHKDLKSLARYFHKSPAELLEEAGHAATRLPALPPPSIDVRSTGAATGAA